MPDLPDARLEVGGTECQPSFERDGVLVAGAGRGDGKGVCCVVEARLRRGHAGAAAQQVVHRLVDASLRFLHQEPDVRGRRSGIDRAAVRIDLTGEHTQQGRLPDSVGADEPRSATGNDGCVDLVEDDARTPHDRDATGEQGC